MANPSIDGVDYQVRLHWLLHGQICYNVLHFTSRGVQDLVDNLLVPVMTCVTDHLIPVLSHDVELTGADVKNITGSVAQEVEAAPADVGVGSESVDSLPSINAAVISLKTTHPGRSGRGRMFLPGIPEDKQQGSKLDPVFITAAAAFLACMVAAFVNSDPLATPFFHWSVRSRKDTANYPITTAVCKPIIGSMRSRKIS